MENIHPGGSRASWSSFNQYYASRHEGKLQFIKIIQCANVFLYKDQTAKLGDMNVSKLANKDGLNFTQTGTPYYAR